MIDIPKLHEAKSLAILVGDKAKRKDHLAVTVHSKALEATIAEISAFRTGAVRRFERLGDEQSAAAVKYKIQKLIRSVEARATGKCFACRKARAKPEKLSCRGCIKAGIARRPRSVKARAA